MVISQEVATCLTRPANRKMWLTWSERLLTAVLGKVFHAISIMPRKYEIKLIYKSI